MGVRINFARQKKTSINDFELHFISLCKYNSIAGESMKERYEKCVHNQDRLNLFSFFCWVDLKLVTQAELEFRERLPDYENFEKGEDPR